MGREASITMDCSLYLNCICDIVELFPKIGWSWYNADGEVNYLPVGVQDTFEWESCNLTKAEIKTIIKEKELKRETVGITLYHEKSDAGFDFLAQKTSEISLVLDINRRLLGDKRKSNTDVSWYIKNIIQKLEEENCIISYYEFCEILGWPGTL